jgi:hypothetical protein
MVINEANVFSMIFPQGGRAANQWVLPHRCPLNIVKKLTMFQVSSTVDVS